MPTTRLEYSPSPFYESAGGRNRKTISGKAFMQVNLNLIPTDEEQLKLRVTKGFHSEGRLKLLSVWDWMMPPTLKAIMTSCWELALESLSREPTFQIRSAVIDFRH